MAISTYQSYFMQGTGTTTLTWAKLFDFKTDPDLGAAPEQLETTTQSDPAHTYIPGLEANEQKNYTLNYDSTLYDTIKALKGQELDVAEWFGADSSGSPDGHNGKFVGKGYLNIYVNGGDANTVRNMTVVLTMSQLFVKETA